MTPYERLRLEMLTKETAQERAALLEEYDRREAQSARWWADRETARVARHRRQEAAFKALPWWKRIGKSEYDMKLPDD